MGFVRSLRCCCGTAAVRSIFGSCRYQPSVVSGTAKDHPYPCPRAMMKCRHPNRTIVPEHRQPTFAVAVPVAGSGGQGSGGRSRGPCRGGERSRLGRSGGLLCEGTLDSGGGRCRRLANRRQAAQGILGTLEKLLRFWGRVIGGCGVRPSVLLVFSAALRDDLRPATH